MVFFNCNACGEAVKKNQVEKHTFRCRQCHSVSCVDCGKDFVGNAYQSHTKCMTEEQKYCGKGYVPKVNKGEAKQEQWIEKVQEAISKSTSKPSLKSLLEKLQDYPNIPRKKAKFENFLKNSLRIHSTYLVSEVWDILMTAAPTPNGNQSQSKAVSSISNEEGEENGKESSPLEASDDQSAEKKLSKRERKEERQKKNKTEKKDRVDDKENESKNKGKKRKHEESEGQDEHAVESGSTSKKKKKKGSIDSKDIPNGTEDNEESTEEVKPKFNLESTILTIVKKKEEISLKKLRKKVLNCFQEEESGNLSEERMLKKLDKKLQKMNEVTVFKDKVMLTKVKKNKYT